MCVAMTSALDELYGLWATRIPPAEDAKIEAVTLAQVKAAANKYLKPDALVIAVVKPEGVRSKLTEKTVGSRLPRRIPGRVTRAFTRISFG